MSNSIGTSIGHIAKLLLIAALKFIALALAFTFRITGLLLTKMSELFEKMAHGNH